jgi:serine/threonine-protein kinase RsbW
MRKLLTALITDAKSRGIINLYGNAFTMHTDSQRTNLKFDFFESALQLARLPVGSVTCMLENNLKGAGNVLTYFLYLSPPELYTVYLPPHHKEILREIYKKLGIERRFEDTGMAQPPELPIESELELTLKTEHMVATISVLSQGKDLEARVRAKMVELEDKGFNSIFIDLALKDPASPASVRTLEGAGFFFSGLLPDYSNGDVLRLQRYFTTVNYNEIECASDFATKLLEYVKGLDPRAKVKET